MNSNLAILNLYAVSNANLTRISEKCAKIVLPHFLSTNSSLHLFKLPIVICIIATQLNDFQCSNNKLIILRAFQ